MKRPLLISGIVVGTLLALGPLWGMLGTAFGMSRAFKVLGTDNLADPKALSGDIGIVLYSSMLGLAAFLVGIVLLTLCIILLVIPKNAAPPPPLPPAE